MAVANTTLSPYLLAAMHEHCLGRHGNISPTFSPPLDSTEAVGKEGEEEDTDFGAVMYITAVLVFYSLGIVVMIIKYLKTERKEMEEEVNLENFFKGIPSKRIEHEREAVNRVAIRAFHTLTSRAAPPQTIQPGARDNPIADMDDECDLSPDRNESDGDGSDGGDNSPNLLHRERSKYLPRVSLMFRDNRPPYERRKMNESVKSQGGRLPREDRSLDAITPGQQSPNTAPLAEQERDGEAPVPGARHADSVPQLKNPGPASCSIVSEEQFRPRRNASHNSLRKLRNGDAPRSSVVSFSDGIQPGLRKKRPENGSPKAHLDSPRTVQKSALKRSSPSRDSPVSSLRGASPGRDDSVSSLKGALPGSDNPGSSLKRTSPSRDNPRSSHGTSTIRDNPGSIHKGTSPTRDNPDSLSKRTDVPTKADINVLENDVTDVAKRTSEVVKPLVSVSPRRLLVSDV